MATNLALNNVFVANLANSNRPLSVAHGCYGLGGTRIGSDVNLPAIMTQISKLTLRQVFSPPPLLQS